MRSLGHALGPARGTLCFSGAIITACDILRQLANRVRRGGGGIVGIILKYLLSCLLDLLQEIVRYISTMATIQVRLPDHSALRCTQSLWDRTLWVCVRIEEWILKSQLLGDTVRDGTRPAQRRLRPGLPAVMCYAATARTSTACYREVNGQTNRSMANCVAGAILHCVLFPLDGKGHNSICALFPYMDHSCRLQLQEMRSWNLHALWANCWCAMA